ncbi:MAG: M23 family metallopeptidase [Methylococcaceae bacterium]|nr:M23 family metallopeptidase [Methylococcaceae bacterium]
MRSKLSETKFGSKTLVGYDWSVNKAQQGFVYTQGKARELLDKTDHEWLDNIIDSVGVRPEKSKDYSDADPAKIAGQLIWPIKAGKRVALTSPYGWRWGKTHRGIDIGAPSGTPVYAIASGRILFASDGNNGFGKLIIIQHKGTTSSYYAHNSKLKVKKGNKVHQGQLIALVGTTGRSTGLHLHFEIRRGRDPVDPCDRLPRHKTFKC